MDFLASSEISSEGLHEIGGKAANLHMLQSMKYSVPQWGVIPKTVLEKVLAGAKNEEIETRILEYKIDQSVLNHIRSHFRDTKYVAVRSSATDEDGAAFSFAGQFESYLFVELKDIEAYIKKVWRSAYSERVQHYRQQNKLALQGGMAVIIQAMVDADVSGVGFGVDPVSGDTDTKIISAVYGLGEGLVSGKLDADIWLLKGNAVTETLANKAYRMTRNGSGGLQEVQVENELQNKPALDRSQLGKISLILEELASKAGKPQDIEFAVASDQIYLLQARPVTAIKSENGLDDERIVWDNSNIIESYPGITSPLTFSFILPVYEAVYKQFCRMMGVSEKDIAKHSHVFANMLGLLQGRVYYNLLSWYRLLALLPGYSLNAEFMEKMMGVKERFELKDLPKHSRLSERLRVGKMIFIMLRNLRSLPRQRKDFVRGFKAVMDKYDRIRFEEITAHELVSYYLDFEQTLISKWKAPLVNDFFAMIYFGTLQKMISKLAIEGAANLQNDLLCGAHDIISTQPAKLSIAISEEIRKDGETRQFFLEHDETEILTALKQGRFPSAGALIFNYIRQFGERYVGELKLETITYRQDPAAFIRYIKALVSQENSHAKHERQDEQKIRADAERRLHSGLKGKPFRQMFFAHLLRATRSLVSQRENLRYERTRAFGVVRRIFIALGEQFAKDRVLDDARDIFYLEKGEIFAFIEGTAVTTSLKELVALRKKEFAAYEAKNLPERIETFGAVNQSNIFDGDTGLTATLTGDLRGLGCCPGRVKARVRIVLDPNEVPSLDGDILVTASTDPGWVILFPTASAILVERGSLLSHSAIVSREMGIPCIVGISGLLSTLQSGDEVEMDGATGEVKIISTAQ